MIQQNKILDYISNTLARRHYEKVLKRGPDECRPWQGANKGPDDYGLMRIDGKLIYAHRVALVIATRKEIAVGKVVDHTCMNKRCCNPAHLQVISQTKNVTRYHVKVNPKTICPRGHKYVRGSGCGVCRTENHTKWVAANPERVKEIQRKRDAKKAADIREWRSTSGWTRNPDVVS